MRKLKYLLYPIVIVWVVILIILAFISVLFEKYCEGLFYKTTETWEQIRVYFEVKMFKL